jgi:hypothetical protein
VLGDLNDADVAAGWLDDWGARAGAGDGTRAAEALAALERDATADLRDRWRAAWDELAEPKLRAWM